MSDQPEGERPTSGDGETDRLIGTPDTEQPDEPEIKVVDRRWWVREAAGEGSATEATSRKPTYVEELERQLAERDELLANTRAQYREAADEFDQARVRLRKEIMKDLDRSKRSVLTDFLEIIDNLERALDSARESPNPEALLTGVQMVRDQFLAKLEGAGISRMASLGRPFDPSRHEAVSTVPTTDPDQDEVVVGVVTEGYLVGDEVLRAATVAVAKRTDA